MNTNFFILLVTICTCTFVAKAENHAAVLGHGFGKIITIKGKMIDDNDTKLRRDLGRTLVEVTEINGKSLDKPVVIPASAFTFTSIIIPKRGTRVELRGYETGGYRGIPQEAFKDIPLVANDGFYFESSFMITSIVSPRPVESTPDSKN